MTEATFATRDGVTGSQRIGHLWLHQPLGLHQRGRAGVDDCLTLTDSSACGGRGQTDDDKSDQPDYRELDDRAHDDPFRPAAALRLGPLTAP